MTHEELTAAVNGLATGENADAVAAIGKEIDSLYTTIDTATRLHEEDTKKISALNDTNMKLFLRVTGTEPEGNGSGEESETQTLEEFVKTLIPEKKEDK